MKLDRDNLIRARERLGYSIETVAEEAGIAKNSVLRAEHGEDIRPLTARKIAAALGVEVADLYESVEYPKGSAPPSPEPSFEDMLDGERREAMYGSWLEFTNRYAERWQRRIEAGELDLGSVNEFVRVLEELLPTLGELNNREQAELPPQPYSHGVPAAKTGQAIHRLLNLFNPLITAYASKAESSDLERLRRKRAELDKQYAEAG